MRTRSLVLCASSILLAVSCGARTNLAVDESPGTVTDAGRDATADAKLEASAVDAASDARRDGGLVTTRDAALPTECDVLPVPAVYLLAQRGLVSAQAELYSFEPPTRTFTKIGDVHCPGAQGQAASMAVDRRGVAYSSYTDGTLWRVSTKDASCAATPYAKRQLGWSYFGMAFVANGQQDELFVSSLDRTATLGTIDTNTFVLSKVGNYSSPLDTCELTGTGAGQLFAFCVNDTRGSSISEIDKRTAAVLGTDNLSIGDPSDGFAFAFWGGKFWVFTNTKVTEYDPVTKTETFVTNAPAVIIGAGVSTCSPL